MPEVVSEVSTLLLPTVREPRKRMMGYDTDQEHARTRHRTRDNTHKSALLSSRNQTTTT